MSENIDNKDYLKGVIYIIYNINDPSLVYVGSTENFKKRINKHHTDSKKYLNRPVYKAINNNWNCWKIDIYEEYICSNIEDLKRREGEITKLIGTLNKNIAGRTLKEYYEDNRVKKLEYQKHYDEINREKIKQYKKQYYINRKLQQFREILDIY